MERVGPRQPAKEDPQNGGPIAGRASDWPARSAPRPIRVALVDDHHLVREGLRLVLAAAAGIEIVGEAANRDGASRVIEETRPDVLLLDLSLPEGDGLPLLRSLRALHPGLRIIVLTMHSDPETVRQALAGGASGYLVKGAQSHELYAAIRAVSRGERYLHSSVTAAVVDDSIRWLQTGRMTAREREVLTLLASGNAPAQIGRTLDISVHTVRRHIANVSDKLGLRGTSALTRYAIRHGLVRDDLG
jgi:DNA-binding NarL/FixJ family response regulator